MQVDPEAIRRAIGPRTRAVMAVHLYGHPCDMDAITAICDEAGLLLIEDCAEAFGTLWNGRHVGTFGDAATFSFFGNKTITTGEGGMVTTNDPALSEALRAFRSHGIDRTPTDEPWFYDAAELGFNYRLTDIQAALGSSQLTRLDAFIDRRNEIANTYREQLADLPVSLPPAAPEGYRHGYHLFSIQVSNRGEVFNNLRNQGIGVQVHYVPVHHHGVSRDLLIPAEGYPAADSAYAGLISLPIFPGLSDSDQQQVVEALKSAT